MIDHAMVWAWQDIFESSSLERSTTSRAIAARCLIRYAAQSQRDVADLLNIGSGSAVCKQIGGLPDKMANDRRLCRQIERIDKTLTQAKAARGKAPAHASP